MITILYKIDELAAVAEQIIQHTPSRIFTIEGQMGAGKTTLVAAIGRFIGCVDAVSSPTFPIINQYKCASGLPIYHLDLYRLKNQEEAIDIGIEAVLYDQEAYIFIEWHELVSDLLPADTVHISLSVIDETTRSLTIHAV
jgi:tRNA threonylcarbamoyladenosine biosynthesis protein TsaE